MTAHGSTAGYQAHRRDGEKPCPACVAAKSRYEKERLYRGGVMVPAIGTRRRIQALKAMGHSGADIAARLKISYQAVHKLEHGPAEHVRPATAKAVARVYGDMSMTLATGPHRNRIRGQAAAHGYAPPLAWDDIDTDARPKGVVATAVKVANTQTRTEILRDLDARRAGISEACRVLHVAASTLERWCERNQLRPMYVRLLERETHDQEYRNQYTVERSA